MIGSRYRIGELVKSNAVDASARASLGAIPGPDTMSKPKISQRQTTLRRTPMLISFRESDRKVLKKDRRLVALSFERKRANLEAGSGMIELIKPSCGRAIAPCRYQCPRKGSSPNPSDSSASARCMKLTIFAALLAAESIHATHLNNQDVV